MGIVISIWFVIAHVYVHGLVAVHLLFYSTDAPIIATTDNANANTR